MKKLIILCCVALFFCSTGSILAQAKKDTTEKSKDGEEKKKDDTKTIADATKSCKKIDGLFPIYQDTAKGNIFMEVRSDQLDKEFLHFFHVENGSANAGWVKGSYGWESIFKIKKYYDRIEFLEQNLNYYFDPESALANASSANITEPLFHMEKVVAMSASKDTFLISADALFLSESLAQLSYSSPPGKGPKNPYKKGGMSKNKSKVQAVKNYPKNTDVIVDLVYENKSPTNFGLSTITDARFNTIQVQHNLIELPDNDYQPRYEDPRVGHFVTEVTDQTSTDPTPYRDMIHRWHLVKQNPGAAMSEPVEPITFWMENTTPVEIRPIIKDAVERWNLAFESAGFKNAVVVKQQPDDAEWDAGDLRYNVLRWTAAPFTGSAWGPSFVNPRTGQILGADIMLDYTFIRGVPTETAAYDLDTRTLEEMIEEDVAETMLHPNQHSRHICQANEGAIHKISMGKTIAKLQDFEAREVKRMERETLIELLLHEVGHTLGLAHNYISSHLWDAEQVHDRKLTEAKGMTSSVMDYNPMNLASDKNKQGNFQSVVPGPYDHWAINYAYSEAASDEQSEKARLEKILSRSTEDQLRFANDADAMFSSSAGIDPRINAWDLSSDAMKYATDRIALCQTAMSNLMERMVDEGDSYQQFRSGYYRLLWDQASQLRSTVRYIGGVEIDRNMHGQNTERPPFTPVSHQQQKRAVDIINRYGFSPAAFSATKDVYTHLQRQRRGWNHWGGTEDPKILQQIGSYQRMLLSHIMHPNTLTRLNNSRQYGNAYSVVAMLGDVTSGIFSADLKGTVNPARQNLQQTYVDGLISGLSKGSYDQITKSAIFHQLEAIHSMIKKNKGKQLETKAHRSFLRHKIDQALDKD